MSNQSTANPIPVNTLFLLIEIAARRQKLQDLFDNKGQHTDAEVLEASVELDELINQYQRCLLQKQIHSGNSI